MVTKHTFGWVYGQNQSFWLGFDFGRETEIKPDCNRVPKWSLRSFIRWLKFCLIVQTSRLLKVFFWLNRTTYSWLYWFPLFCDFFFCMAWTTLICMCCTWQWPPIFASVYSLCDTGQEALKASKIHVQFQGFYDLTFCWLYYANTTFVKRFFLSYVANHYWLYWFLIFCDFCLCMLWNTCRCMHYMWHWPSILTGVYSSHDANWEALKVFKILVHF